jgi:hypothetical protein
MFTNLEARRHVAQVSRSALVIAQRGGKSRKKRAIMAVVRKLAVWLHHRG